jgi:hypothetical protein
MADGLFLKKKNVNLKIAISKLLWICKLVN